MALTGLQIQKLLPKTNCKECGSNTCLAFAMKLAAKKADLSQCPYASDEAKQVLGAASEPPVKALELGENKTIKLGDETVLYRHEKTFVNPTALAINIDDGDDPTRIETTLSRVRDYVVERVGESLSIDLVCVTQTGSDDDHFVRIAQKAHESAGRPLVLRSAGFEALQAAARALAGSRCVLVPADAKQSKKLVAVAQENGHVLAATAENLDELTAITKEIKQNGFNDLLLHFQIQSFAEGLQTRTIARRAAIRENLKALGYPGIHFVASRDPFQGTVEAVDQICKYGGICVLPIFDPAQLATLMTLRLNIYTDPQKPIQVEPKLYPIGEPKTDSPVFVTTNFSLTYFIVSGEIENSGCSAWLLVPECEGMSVLTAWAAGKFSGAHIAKFAREIDLESQVSTRSLIIPGYVAQISGDLEESLPGWKAVVGPQEAADLESFIKAKLN
ncbi:acetyl-CoA decarbonylase/synthase complex subunit gamma [candidate division KSB1 bacterium]|nr:acetyl-CoA decarbonylase/synthase complex subunit gamma [candidate division KSB1 bacterium]